MSGSGLEPFRAASVSPRPAADGFWDTAASRDNEVWRYARRLAAAAAHQHDRAPRCAGRKAAPVVKEGVATRPPATAARRLALAARGVGRALLLVGAAVVGLACGMSAGGDALPLDLRSWGLLVAQAAPAPVAADAILAVTVTLAAARPKASMPPVRATDWFATELVDGVTLAATMRAIPAGAVARPDRPAPAPAPALSERAAAPYRVQLATLRNPRNAEPVWVDFTSRLGALTSGLERHVLPTRTKRGLRHLVQAGPFANAGAARAMCGRFRAAGGDCLVVAPPT